MIHNDTMHHRRRRIVQAIVCTFALSTWAPAFADAGYSLSAGVSHSDNIRRNTDALAEDDIVSNLTGAIIWNNQSPRLSASFFGQGTYLKYRDDTFEGEFSPRGTLNIDWDIFPARMRWALNDRFGQISSDPFGAFTPDSIENTNIVTTGPDFTFGSSPAQLLVIGFRVEDQWYEIQPVDNRRVNGQAVLTRQLTEEQSIGVTAFAESVEFDDVGTSSNYDIYEAFVSYSRSIRSFEFSIDAGGTALDIEGEKSDGVLGRLNLTKDFSSGWAVGVSGEYSFTDSGNRFLIGREQNTAGPGQSVDDDTLFAGGSPLRLQHFDIDAGRQGDRHSMDFNLYWETEDFELDPQFDREQTGATFSYSMRINPRNLMLFRGNYRDVKYDSVLRNDENTELEFRYQRNMSENIALSARIARLERTSSDVANEYKENVYGLVLSYNSDQMESLQRRPRSGTLR